MAFCAFQRRRLVKEDFLAGNLTDTCVTAVTFDVGVPALERELSSLIVIERRRYPSLHVMTVCARRFSRLCNELAAVRVHVATLAVLWRSLELRLSGAG
jgi:hypothetical protein